MTDRDPRFERMQRYEPGRRPYVQLTGPDLGKYHARVIGWIPGEVFIEYPIKIRDYVTTGQLDVAWVPTAAAIRIRRSDSIWLSTEDDHDWHEHEDQKIKYRADPWTVYQQEASGTTTD